MTERTNLDLLRSLAVGCVVISHFRRFAGWTPEADATYDLDTLGLLGVMIFFVHTTLVLMMSLERHGATATPFYVRRIFRIYPLSIAVVLLCSVPKWLDGSVNAAELASNLLLIQNITGHASWPQPLWTLPYEVQMYLFLPIVYLITTWRMGGVWLAFICAIAMVLATLPWAKSFLLLTFVPSFLPGAIAFQLGRTQRSTLGPIPLLSFVLAAAAGLPLLVAGGLPQVPLFWIFCLCLGFLIPHCRQVTGTGLTVIAKTIAKYSYGVYLTHPWALWIGLSMPGPLGVRLAASLVMLAALSFAAYYAIEKPGINLGVRLSAWVAARERWRMAPVKGN